MAADPSKEERGHLKELLHCFKSDQDLFRRYVLPIYEDDEQRRPSLVGTCLVVLHCGRVFLVTAKHVLQRLQPGGNLYIYNKVSQRRHLGGRIAWNRSDGNEDLVDIGVLCLEGEGLPPFPEINCTPLHSSQFATATEQRDGRFYVVLGYPASRSTVNKKNNVLRVEPYANFGPAISAEGLRKLGLDPCFHIAIAFHKNRVVGVSGNTQSFPDPAGMSGSPMFLVYDAEAPQNAWGNFKVAGILIEYRAKQQVLLGTNIAIAIDLMDRCISDDRLE